MIGLCTDSNAQLPQKLGERYGAEVVPLTVVVDGQSYQEGIDLDADQFFARFERGKPEVSTAAPSPGAFAAAYQRLADRGATEILSVHLGASLSGTLNAARLGSQLVDVPVRLVDTNTASFAIACCLWEAADAIERGADIEAAARVAESIAERCGNVFIVGALDLARAGGRLAAGVEDSHAVPVLALVDGAMAPVATVATGEDAVAAMAEHVRASGTRLRVGVGWADAATEPLADDLVARLTGTPEVLDVVRYRIAPSVGVHTGPGTVGAVYYPSPSGSD